MLKAHSHHPRLLSETGNDVINRMMGVITAMSRKETRSPIARHAR